jgi:HD-GYP domain-containing protein (c-di-GMP phosphodiesterase class II)
MKALFIGDNKEEWESLKRLFNVHFSKIDLLCVIDADAANEYLSFEGPFAMVIIDSSLRSCDPTKLAKSTIEIAGRRPIIFYGNQTLIRDRVDEKFFNSSEQNHILNSPIDIPKFKVVIQKAIDWAKEEEFEKSIEEIDREDLLPMKLRNFYLFDQIGYNVFVELTGTKFIKVISANKKYIHNDINAYAKRGVKFLYLRKDEYLKFLEESIDKLLEIFSLHKKMKDSKIVINQIRAVLVIHQHIRTVGVSDKIIELCDMVIEVSKNIIIEHKKFRSILKLFPASTADLAEQSIMTLYLCESILSALGWSSETSRKKLGLAAILYDSMLSNDDLVKVKSLEDPQLEVFTEEEREEFRYHPIKAAEMARHFQGYSEVDFIIAQHHEKPNGDGFPSGLSSNKLTAHSCAFILANNFIINFTAYPDKKNALLHVFREIKHLYNISNFKEPLTALQRSIV